MDPDPGSRNDETLAAVTRRIEAGQAQTAVVSEALAAACMMKRVRRSQNFATNRDYDEQLVASSREQYQQQAGQPYRMFRQVELTRLKAPIALPRWSRHGFKLQPESTVVPQLAPEIHLVAPDEFIYSCDVDEIDESDRQVDVCALEETEASGFHDSSGEGGSAKRAKFSMKNEAVSPVHDTTPRNVNKARILKESRRRKAPRDYYEDEVVQEEIEVVDAPSSEYFPSSTNSISRRTISDRYSINVSELFDEISKHEPQNSVEHLNELFVNDPSIQYPLNVNMLVQGVKSATVEQNARMIAGLAMQVNSLKKEVQKLHADIIDTRSASLHRQNNGLTGRVFDLNAEVTQEWVLVAQAPLRSVDLVGVARALGVKIGRKNLRNRDVITRYIRCIFDEMIPKELIHQFTVRDRPMSKGKVNDIGIDVKEQITGAVLDLLGLYDVNKLSNTARIDRAHFADFANQAMKTVMYDMRRISPKSKKPDPGDLDDFSGSLHLPNQTIDQSQDASIKVD
ncbi:unnamed protein product [Bursaphelenchus xylophilus]|uniref:(pine wood nematode) hypothetical protein n=1 Tax=Bursaphelenchus xylophilus TaxID=6326 RepID=A0A1I7RY27_BURXY|nr:unnamed protein product [Bursaphelenchus xylophilus]CAG9085216.1 unnamed protein product [Bursaphelenchus xylophilus]